MQRRSALSSDRFSATPRSTPALQERPEATPAKAIQTIVVPLDGSQCAEHALTPALAIARRCGATLRLVHVFSRLHSIEPWDRSHAGARIDTERRDKERYLAQVAKRVLRRESLSLETLLVDSTEMVESLTFASTGVDLMVLATRRRKFASHLWWMSTYNALRRRLSTPLHLVQGYPAPVDLTADPIARHILVPLDGSLRAASIVEHATHLAKLGGAKLTLLNVQNEHWSRGCFEYTTPSSYLTSMVRCVQQTMPSVEAHVMTTKRSIAAALAEFAEARNVDQIAMASGADDGFSRLLRGSVADRLLRRTALPVIIQAFDDRPQRQVLTTVA